MTGNNTWKKLFENEKFLILDGAMATELEARGCDINDSLWSAKMLAEKPELIQAVHEDYFEVGAEIGIAASYQATIPGFMAKGFTREESIALIRRSMELLLAAKANFEKAHPEANPRIAAGSIGPYGAYLADGSEYRGDYRISTDEMSKFHRERMEILKDAGAEMFACETMPCLWEAEVVSDLAEELEIPCWVSFTGRNESQISDGTEIAECAKALDQKTAVLAIGINCTAPEYVTGLIKNIRKVSEKPIIVYPNRGEIYDAVRKVWRGGKNMKKFDIWAKEWYEAGANIIGGCCRTSPEQIQDIRAYRESL